MRYVWHENVRLHTLSYALTKKTDISDHLLAPGRKKRKYLSIQDLDVEGIVIATDRTM